MRPRSEKHQERQHPVPLHRNKRQRGNRYICLIIATATGVHPVVKGCLTLELSNVGELPIAIEPGTNICRLFLHRVETENEEVDKSLFIGLRRPTIGKLHLDPIARRLADAYSNAPTTTPRTLSVAQ